MKRVADKPKTEVLELPAEKAEIVPHKSELDLLKEERELARERLAGMEDRLFEKSMAIIEGALSAPELGGEGTEDNPFEMPEEWLHEMSAKDSARRFRVAKEAHKNGKDAPVFLKMSEGVAMSIIKARSVEKAAPRSLNIDRVVITVPEQHVFEEIVVEERE